jgi:hypothetical protein
MISEFVEEIILKAQETESNFIFQTIRPYCESIITKEISKEELERALLRFYNNNSVIDVKEWMSSFNTESASCCFNAVQELKKKVEKENE